MPVTDVHFAIGKTHKVCQDYGVATSDFVAVADGCSSSPHTDIGARILAHAALKSGDPYQVADIATKGRLALDLPPESLDATLLTARRLDFGVEARIFGDGLIVGVHRNGGYVCHQHTYSHNAPAYLSYLTDTSRLNAYMAAKGTMTIRTWEPDCQDSREYTSVANPESVFTYRFPSSQFSLVCLMTDGADSFQVRSGTGFEPVPMCEVLAQVLDFKSISPGFVQRRLQKFFGKFCPVNQWTHTDDFTLGAIYTCE